MWNEKEKERKNNAKFSGHYVCPRTETVREHALRSHQYLKNISNTLAQGCPSSMNWFALSINPFLLYLERRLTVIPILSLPRSGPQVENGDRPANQR